MNKTELIAAVAEKAGLTKKDVEKAVEETADTADAEEAVEEVIKEEKEDEDTEEE